MMQEFVQRIIEIAREQADSVHTAFPGKIVSFDPAKCLATVQPILKYNKPDGDRLDYPQIYGVPVVFPQSSGQKATIAFPVKAGDYCLCVVSEQALDLWMYGQETETDLRHDLTNAVCIPGLFTKPNAAMRDACSSDAIIMDADGTRVIVSKDSIVLDGNVTVTGTLTYQNENN